MIARESYTVWIDGHAEPALVGLSRRGALGAAFAYLDLPATGAEVAQIDIIEQATCEPRASWRRVGQHWKLSCVPAWVS